MEPGRVAVSSSAVRRVLALTRDERSLTAAVYRLEHRKFDTDTERRLRECVDDLIETLTTILYDEAFWDTLTKADLDLTPPQLARLKDIEGSAFADLLRLAGYTTPPKPPVDELVDTTMSSLAAALDQAPTGQASHGSVARAQADIASLLYRVRRQIDTPMQDEGRAHLVRDAGRTLGSGARWLIPVAAGVAAGALVEMSLPATGTGLVVGKGVQKVAAAGLEKLATRGVALASQVLRGRFSATPTQTAPARPRQPTDPVAVHLAALTDQLSRLQAAMRADEIGREHYAGLIYAARRHVRRLARLAIDHDLGEVLAALPDLHGCLDAADRWAAGNDAPDEAPEANTARALAKINTIAYTPFGRGPTAAERQSVLKRAAGSSIWPLG